MTFNATFILVIISFVVFMLLMKAIYFDPILHIKEKRERRLNEDRDAARNFAEEFERIRAEYEAGIKKARRDAHQVIQEIRQEAKAAAQQALAEARQAAQAENDRRMAELADWRETTYRQLEAERESLTRTIIDKVTAGRRVRTASGG